MQTLLSLLIGAPVFIDAIQLRHPDEEQGSAHSDFCTCLFLQRGSPGDRDLYPVQMLAPLPELASRLGDVWGRWSSGYEKLAAIVGLFFSTEMGQTELLDVRFLLIIQALESFHRVAVGGQYLPRDVYNASVYEPFKAWLPGTLPEPLRASLKNKISFGYEFSLRKRLKDLVESLSAQLSATLFTNSGLFATQVADTRNHLTHHDESTKGDVLNGERLHHASEQARVLLVSVLLRYLGFEDSQIVTSVTRNPRIQHALKHKI